MVIVFPYGTCAVCETGLPKPKQRRRRVICDDPACLRAANSYGAKIRNHRETRRRREQPPVEKRCPRCDETKPLTDEFWYVEKRDPHSGKIIRFAGWCRDCKRAYQRETNSPERRERKRAGDAARRARAKSDPEYAAFLRESQRLRTAAWRRANPEAARAIRRRYLERVKADPKRLQRHRESRRISSRLRRERETGQMAQRTRNEGRREETAARRLPHLPAKPLGEAIERRMRQAGVLTGKFDAYTGDSDRFLRKRGLEPRTVRAWRRGERKLVHFDVADRALIGLGLLWWDVWPADEYPEVAARLEADAR